MEEGQVPSTYVRRPVQGLPFSKGTAGVRKVQPGHPTPPGPQPPEPTLDPTPAWLRTWAPSHRRGSTGGARSGGCGRGLLGAVRAVAPRSRGGASGATDLTGSSQLGSPPRAAPSSSRAFAARESAACAPQALQTPGDTCKNKTRERCCLQELHIAPENFPEHFQLFREKALFVVSALSLHRPLIFLFLIPWANFCHIPHRSLCLQRGFGVSGCGGERRQQEAVVPAGALSPAPAARPGH
ncbi:cdc42 effector protein 2 isoform X1 [Ailuropoda melanoleuca]|uniref:cdc42 effector protein 2 isoform X1 n=1 Tax=Ailuropoda melanoleuca TaxID=9646 RepID=UPI00149405A5|nr:cdc42 effector protein 2 isoform X1 [Ailuropoda melanoleuca]